MQAKLGQYDFIKPLQVQSAYLSFVRPQLYLAQALSNKALLVIKILSGVAGKIEQDLFLHEVKVLEQLNQSASQYWLPLCDSGQDYLTGKSSSLKSQSMHYLVLPYMAQGSVKQFLGHQPYTLSQAGQLWLDMLDAVDALHQQGWLHLDLKPSNFLLNSDSSYSSISHSSLHVCLIDFALAQPHPRPNISSSAFLTLDASKTRGTPRYMSPEQFLGQPATVQTDFYSLGLILYELLTGQSMFNASSYQGWAVQHCQHPVALLPKPLAGFQALIDDLLAKKRSNRLSEVTEIRQMAQQAFQTLNHCLALSLTGDQL
ncbi:MAG: serine/threonine protein kinase [Moraxellaceae bacterium]|nr:MAG: serine/threonine protein kinase [Moraxellaceae bacterium]